MKYLVCVLIMFFLVVMHAFAAAQESPDRQKIKIGLRSSPPFIIKTDNTYSGISVELWGQIAPQVGLDFEYVEYDDLGVLLKAIENGDIDLCINPLTVTSQRLEKFGFTQPYFISEMAIAVKVGEANDIMVFMRNLISPNFLKVILLLFVVVFIFGSLIWLVERKKNPEQFGKGIKGLGHGIWWSAVTMTTVGYGDKSPSTGTGRLISIIWMFTAVIIISSFTASISAALTYKKFKTDIRGMHDLRNITAGTVSNSSTASYLSEVNIRHKNFETLKDALIALESGHLDAIVYDEPLLSYLIFEEELTDQIELIPSGVNSVYFGFASNNLQFLTQINPYLIEAIEVPDWKKMLESYNLRIDR